MRQSTPPKPCCGRHPFSRSARGPIPWRALPWTESRRVRLAKWRKGEYAGPHFQSQGASHAGESEAFDPVLELARDALPGHHRRRPDSGRGPPVPGQLVHHQHPTRARGRSGRSRWLRRGVDELRLGRLGHGQQQHPGAALRLERLARRRPVPGQLIHHWRPEPSRGGSGRSRWFCRGLAEPRLGRLGHGWRQRPGAALRLERPARGHRIPGQLLHHRHSNRARGGPGRSRRLRRGLEQQRLGRLGHRQRQRAGAALRLGRPALEHAVPGQLLHHQCPGLCRGRP